MLVFFVLSAALVSIVDRTGGRCRQVRSYRGNCNVFHQQVQRVLSSWGSRSRSRFPRVPGFQDQSIVVLLLLYLRSYLCDYHSPRDYDSAL